MSKKLTEKDIKEIQEYLDERFKTHNAQLKKIQNIRTDMIQQIGPYILNAINYPKTILRKNQLGVGIGDGGIEIRIRVHEDSIIDYQIAEIDWDGNISVFPHKDHVDVIDKILPVLREIFPKY